MIWLHIKTLHFRVFNCISSSKDHYFCYIFKTSTKEMLPSCKTLENNNKYFLFNHKIHIFFFLIKKVKTQ